MPDLHDRLFGPGVAACQESRTALPGAGDRIAAATGEGPGCQPGIGVALHRRSRPAAAVVEQLERLAAQDPALRRPPSFGLFEEANEYLDRFGSEAAGILLIIDELGKFLEYGASNPEQGDVFVLQELAEAATRSARPFLFVTILHQAVDRYADHMSPGRRAEWAKVQGRFEDVAFEERTDQILRLLSHAIGHNADAMEAESLPQAGQKRLSRGACRWVSAGIDDATRAAGNASPHATRSIR